MNDNTSCWDCCAVYPMYMSACPQCGAANANTDFDAALDQMNQQRQDAERQTPRDKRGAP